MSCNCYEFNPDIFCFVIKAWHNFCFDTKKVPCTKCHTWKVCSQNNRDLHIQNAILGKSAHINNRDFYNHQRLKN